MKKVGKNNPKFDEFIMNVYLNISVVITFFRTLNSLKILLKWMLDKIREQKECIYSFYTHFLFSCYYIKYP